MARSPRTLQPDEPFDEIEGFLEHIYLHLLAYKPAAPLAPPIGQLLTDLDGIRASRKALARAVAALEAKEIFADDELNRILDDVKETLAADKSEAGVAFYNDVFENKSPSEVRKPVLGAQLASMTFWPGKLAKSQSPTVQALATETQTFTGEATMLLNDIGAAQTALDQFDLVPRAAFVASCNAAVAVVFGKLAEWEHNPPAGPVPPGFVDRFFVRDSGVRTRSLKDLETIVDRARKRLAKQEAALAEMKKKAAEDLKAKRKALLDEKAAEAAAAQVAAAKAAAELAKLQEELAKEPPEDA
jgi:hypothetical protein